MKFVQRSGHLTIAGEQSVSGQPIWLRGPGTDLRLGAAGSDFEVTLLPGVYDVHYVLNPGDGSGMSGLEEPQHVTDYPVNSDRRIGCIDLRLE